MKDKDISNLTRAVQYWVDYQVKCGREMLLSEAYLSQPIGEFLRFAHSGKIETEFSHPNLQSPGRGRPRQVDFVTLSRDKERPTFALETKWVSAGKPPSPQKIIDDVLRLECVRNQEQQGMKRVFLLAGTPEAVDGKQWWDLEINSGNGRVKIFPDIFPRTLDAETHVKVKDCASFMRQYFKSFGTSYQVEIPISFKIKMLGESRGDSASVLAWKVSSVSKRTTFKVAHEWPDQEVPAEEPEVIVDASGP